MNRLLRLAFIKNRSAQLVRVHNTLFCCASVFLNLWFRLKREIGSAANSKISDELWIQRAP